LHGRHPYDGFILNLRHGCVNSPISFIQRHFFLISGLDEKEFAEVALPYEERLSGDLLMAEEILRTRYGVLVFDFARLITERVAAGFPNRSVN
jgi:hypothetical protein